jgi:predicted AAA+ superfamily ATPase
MIDPALIHSIGFRTSDDRGRMLENIVFLHLQMQGKELFFHKGQKECDFLIKKNNQIILAIQVTTSLANQEVKKREIGGLIEAMDTYDLAEGLIITENDQETIKVDKYEIKVIPVWKWLLNFP